MAKPLYVYEIPSKRHAKGWGKKQPYKKAEDPELPIWFYSSEKATYNWSVSLKEGGTLFQSGVVEAQKVFGNRLPYKIDVAETSEKKYLNYVQLTSKDEERETPKIEKSDTGKYYLIKGNYQFKIEEKGDCGDPGIHDRIEMASKLK